MAQTYEQALKAEIERAEEQIYVLVQQGEQLEAQVQGLKQALALYLRTVAATPSEPKAAVSHPRSRRKGQASYFQKVLQFIKDTGTTGATIEEMYQFAVSNGLKLKRTSIRSNVWNYKQKGALAQIAEGRYRTTLPTDQKTSEKTEGSAGVQPAEHSLKLVGAA